MQAKVLVVGSLNMDLVVRAPRLPRGGETLAGQSFTTIPGGKGANQAVAAARLGAGVAMIGCLGDDAYGDQLYRALQAEGIDCQGVERVAGESSGVALIVVDDSSQNAIVIVAGGNGHLSPAVLARHEHLLEQAQVVVCQLESPLETVGHVLRRAHALGKTVILNPAPATRDVPADWLPLVDYLVPNETESELLCRLPVDSLESAGRAAERLREMGAGRVIVTLGAQGAPRRGGGDPLRPGHRGDLGDPPRRADLDPLARGSRAGARWRGLRGTEPLLPADNACGVIRPAQLGEDRSQAHASLRGVRHAQARTVAPQK